MENNINLAEQLEKTKVFPPKLKSFLIMASEEGAIEGDLAKELLEMISKNRK